MSLNSIQRALGAQQSLARIIEEQERWRRLVERPRVLEVPGRTRVIEEHLQSIIESSTAYQRSIDLHVQRANEMALAVERITMPARLAAIEKATTPPVTNRVIAALSDDLARHQSRLDTIGVRAAVHPILTGRLKDFVKDQAATRLSIIASASSHFDTILDQQSFSKVGAAAIAAARALSDENIRRHDHSRTVDGFFGHWGRLTQLPKSYGEDEDARRETLREIEADEALLDVSTDEAAALFSQTSFSSNGLPIVLLGEPIGLVVTQDPDDVAARLIRRTERALRNQIDRVFRKRHGDNWPDVIIPERAASWSEKRKQDEQNNLPVQELICYAEFTELADILTTHWSDHFAHFGMKAKRVTGRIRALSPHRNYEFHSRPVTTEQLLSIAYSVRMLEPFLSHPDDQEVLGTNGP